MSGRDERDTAFKIRVQRNRLLVFTVAILVGLSLRLSGLVDASYLAIFLIGAIADTSALAFLGLYRLGWHRKVPFNLDVVWLLIDMALISWGIYLSGGAESIYYPWYVANIAAAAFVMSQWAAAGIALVDTIGYLAALWLSGDVRDLGDLPVYEGVGRMICLYAASFFFLRGVAELLESRRRIRQLKNDAIRKVDELTRLTGELETRTHEAQEANLKLTEADRLKSQFLANMSHELRTPLNSIIGFSGILASHLDGQIDERHARFLDYIHSSGEHLLRIINDILDLSKVEAGSLELNVDRFGVRSLMEGVCSVLLDSARRRHVEFEIDAEGDLPPIEADPVRIKQVLYNLLSNAVKFSYENSTITLRARPLVAADSVLGREAVEIAVVDRGIGIDPRDQELIFQEFYQVDGSTSREFEGTGLGLALVQRFVDLHRGVVTVTSALGRGSTFGVVLPVEFQGTAGEAPARGPLIAGAADRQVVLVVEDDPTAFEWLGAELRDGGYRAVRARTGEEALEMAQRLEPLAITLDIVLPGMDGWAVLKQLKADDTTRDVPVIIVSMLDNRELGMALGAVDYFVKPVDTQRLTRRLDELLAHTVPIRPRVLLIDDDPQLHDLVDQYLDAEHYAVEHASSGQEGVARVRESPPDLILLDLMMEGMDGFEVAAALRSDASTARIPIVVLTAKDMTRADRERLHGKIEGLVKKGERASRHLTSVIRDLVRRRAEESGEHD